MKALIEAAKAISQKVFLVARMANAALKVGLAAAVAAVAAAAVATACIRRRGSTRVRAAMMATITPGAPATKKAARQPYSLPTRPPTTRPTTVPSGVPIE